MAKQKSTSSAPTTAHTDATAAPQEPEGTTATTDASAASPASTGAHSGASPFAGITDTPAIRTPGSGVEVAAEWAEQLYRNSVQMCGGGPNPWPNHRDVAGYLHLIEFGIAAAKLEEDADAELGDGFHSSAIALALADSPSFAAARDQFRRDDHPNLQFKGGASEANLYETDEPLRELCTRFFQAGLLAAGRQSKTVLP